MNQKNIFSALIFITLIAVVPFSVHAATLQSVICNLARSLIQVGAGLSVISFIVAGFLFLGAGAKPDLMNAGKMSLLSAVIGIAILILSFSAVTFTGNLLGLEGVNLCTPPGAVPD